MTRLGPRSVQVRQEGAKVEHFVIKLSLPKATNVLGRLAERGRRSRGHRAYLWGHRLRALGIETPRPLGFLERAHAPARHPSFSVSEFIFAPSLIDLRDQQLLAGAHPGALGEKRMLLRRVAQLFARLHAEGLFHGDLHAGNLLVRDGALMVIDLESFRSLRLRDRARAKNLVRLNRDFLDRRQLSTTDRMRFLAAYTQHLPAKARLRRDLFVELLEATEAKLRARGEAFV
ncbi:MAG: lipopolysaccharide kinase InaA family protein [Myxococcota bacterium]